MKEGYLSLIDMNDMEKSVFLTYLEKGKHLNAVPYLDVEFGDNFLTFLDLFAGETIKIPSRNELITVINYSIIYTYLKERGFTSDAYSKASSLFKKRTQALERIVERVEEVLK